MRNTLRKTKALVKQILEENPQARNSDNELYIQICNKLNPSICFAPFGEVVCNLNEYGLPPFETVRRSRQKVQEEHPELRPCDEVALYRAENETAYEEFATT